MTLKDLKEKCEQLRKNGASDGHYIMFRLADVEEVIREVENGPADEQVEEDVKEQETAAEEPEAETIAESEANAEEQPAAEDEGTGQDQLFWQQDIL